MKSHLTSFFNKAILKSTLCLTGLVLHIATIANDGKQPSSVAVKGSGVPVNYYQAFMVGVAVSYGIYLVIRAKRRKRNSKITE